ncbi:uncharacterized protein V1516DRAFT_682287 [Lipomyces oligophaga]|uniref:uncharacterized protein n=1 Tax=Lipomyces oligophaga TaxID=45792 RepID=UPI0034CD40B1
MVFKSFAAIARHSALAKNLFVASTATSAQPAFFVSTQQLARQQATIQAQQLITRGSLNSSFSTGAGAGSGSGAHPSANGAAFPSFANSFSSSAPLSAIVTSDDDRHRLVTESPTNPNKSLYSHTSPSFLSAIASSPARQHLQIRRLSGTAGSSKNPPQITEAGEIGSQTTDPEIDDQFTYYSQFKDSEYIELSTPERLIEVDDETAAHIIASQAEIESKNDMQLQLYRKSPFSSLQKVSSPPVNLDLVSTKEIPSSVTHSPEELPCESRELQKSPLHIQPESPSVHDTANLHNSDRILDQFFRHEDYEGLINYYELMKSEQLTPSLASFNKILSSIACGDSEALDPDRVGYLLNVYAHMITSQVVPNVHSYTVVIVALLKRYRSSHKFHSQIFESYRFHTMAEDEAEGDRIFDQADKMSCSDPSLDLALDIFFASVSAKLQNYPIEVYNILFDALSLSPHNERVVSLLEVLDRAVGEGIVSYTADTYLYLLKTFRKDINSAVEVFETYTDGIPFLADPKQIPVYSEMIRAYFYSGHPEQALEFFNKIVNLKNFKRHIMFKPLAAAMTEGFVSVNAASSAWTWLKIALDMKMVGTTIRSLRLILSGASRDSDVELANEMYELLWNNDSAIRTWSAEFSDYLYLRLRTTAPEHVSSFADFLQSLIESKSQVQIKPATEAFLYVIRNSNATERDIAVAMAFLDMTVAQKRFGESSYEFGLVTNLVESSILQALPVLNVQSMRFDMMRSLTSIASNLSETVLFSAVAEKAPSESLLGYIITQNYHNLFAFSATVGPEIDMLAYIYSRTLLTFGTLQSPFASQVAESLNSLLSYVAQNNIMLSERTNFFVTQAAPLVMVQPVPDMMMMVPPPVEVPSVSISVAETPVFNPNVMTEVSEHHSVNQGAEIPCKAIGSEPIFSILQWNQELTRNVLRMILADASADDLLLHIQTIYDNKMTIAPHVIAKVIAFAGENKNVKLAQTMFRLSEHTIPSPRKEPILFFVWQSLYKTMMTALFAIEDKKSLRFKNDLVRLKNDLMAMGAAPDASQYAHYIHKLKSAGSHDEASEAILLFKEAMANGVKPNTFLFNALLSKLSKARRYREALTYFDQMESLGLGKTSVTFGTLISAACRAGDIETAERLFEDMVRAPNYSARIAPCNSLLQFYVTQQRDREMALKWFDRINKLKLTPSTHSYKLLIDAYASIEPVDINSALGVLETIKASGTVPEEQHYASIINSYGCVLHELDKAQEFFDQVASTGVCPGEVMYQALIASYCANGRVEETDRIIADMQEIHGIKISCYMANTLIQGWMNLDINRSRAFFDEIYSSKKIEPSTFEAMIRAYIETEHFIEAAEIEQLLHRQRYPAPVVAGILKWLKNPVRL